MAEKKGAEDRRKARVRRAIRKAANGRPRLSIHRSSKQIYAQVIDDERGVTRPAPTSRLRPRLAGWSPSAPSRPA
jgi:large subunit ribosomal protein L18